MANKKKFYCCPDEPGKKKKCLNKTDKRILLCRYAKAIGHPIRLQILQLLKSKNSCICGELVDELPVAQATVSQHLKVLKNSGLIRGTISGPATCYCIDQVAIDEFKTLIEGI